MKEITERLPEEQISTGNLDFNAEQTSCDRSRPSNGSCVTTAAVTDCSGSSNTPVSAKGIKSRKQKAERMIQVEPGIYLYLFSLPDGGNELKRVRFRYLSF